MGRACSWVVAGAILLGGCAQVVDKRAFLAELITLCAGVNERLENVDPTAEPGRVAAQLEGLVEDARSRKTPEEDREALDRMLSALEDSARKFRVAEESREQEGGAHDAALEEASDSLESADRAAQAYGMPPLDTCDEVVAGETPTASPEPTATESVSGWREVGDARIARQQVAAAVVEGTIWVVGGLEENNATARVEGYDPAVDAWKAGPDLPIPLHHAMAVSYRGELVVLGGWQPQGSDLTAVISDRVFALRSGVWVELPRLNQPRAAGAAAVVDDRIVVVGGQADGQLLATTELFDGTRWRDGADIPTPREHLAAAAEGSHLYAVGGRALSADTNTAALERYDPATDRWEQLPPMPTPRGSLAATVVDGRLIAVGGEEPTAVLGTVQAYDIASSTWSELAPLPTARHGLGVGAVGTTLYAINGATKPTHAQSSATVEVLDFV
ncbi:MAG: hypothetical protein M3N52_00120 [Actinomycetota bacterium]|nr:hypothetical protein [Actinomycetota bacterium]